MSENKRRSVPDDIVTPYPINVLSKSKKRFQKYMKDDKKTVWELFRDMLQAYDEKYHAKAAEPAA